MADVCMKAMLFSAPLPSYHASWHSMFVLPPFQKAMKWNSYLISTISWPSFLHNIIELWVKDYWRSFIS
jgi:hypothetical protein